MPSTTTPQGTAKARPKARNTGRAKAAAARQSPTAVRESQRATRESTELLGDYAERAVLIPVGAALIARERVLSSVSDVLSNYSSRPRAQAQMRRFERRGATARRRLEREVRKARVRVERELRQRRREIESTVNDLDARREAVARNGSELANRVQERILSLV